MPKSGHKANAADYVAVRGMGRYIGAVSRANGLRTHPLGRICRHAGCITVLSKYNPSSYCFQHDAEDPELHFQRTRGGRVVGIVRPKPEKEPKTPEIAAEIAEILEEAAS